MALMFILAIVLLVALLGSLPAGPHSKNLGYFPAGVISVAMVIVLMFIATAIYERINRRRPLRKLEKSKKAIGAFSVNHRT
jgi:uncharacterized membrane protein YbhN (UPF0104 family)